MSRHDDVFQMIGELNGVEVMEVMESLDPDGYQKYAQDPWDALLIIAEYSPEKVVKAILDAL